MKSVNHDQTSPSDFEFPTGFPTSNPDLDGGGYHTSLSSANGNIVAIYDDPGMNLGYYTNFTSAYSGWFSSFTTNTSFHVGDYAYQKRRFTYSLTNSIGSAYGVATTNVGTILVAQKTRTNNVIASDWTNIIDTVSTTNIPNCAYFTTNEIRQLVGGTNRIMFDPSVTNAP